MLWFLLVAPESRKTDDTTLSPGAHGPDYAAFSNAGLQGGVKQGEPSPGTTLVILYAKDLEKAEKKVVGAGGEIVERHEFPGGRSFHFRDTTGDVLGVWTKAE